MAAAPGAAMGAMTGAGASTPLMSGAPADAPPANGVALDVSLSPADRLTLSRERLREAMRNKTAQRSSSPSAGAGATAWLDSLKAIPGAGVVVEAVRSWWAQHPLRVASMVAADATKSVLQPMAEKNPLGLVLGALVLGGLLAWSRPWRWLIKPALFAGLLPQLVSKALAHVPSRSWLAVLASLIQEQQRPPATASPRPPSG